MYLMYALTRVHIGSVLPCRHTLPIASPLTVMRCAGDVVSLSPLFPDLSVRGLC